MNKAELWDELKECLTNEIFTLNQISKRIKFMDSYEELRYKTKAVSMNLILQKMEDYERNLLD